MPTPNIDLRHLPPAIADYCANLIKIETEMLNHKENGNAEAYAKAEACYNRQCNLLADFSRIDTYGATLGGFEKDWTVQKANHARLGHNLLQSLKAGDPLPPPAPHKLPPSSPRKPR